MINYVDSCADDADQERLARLAQFGVPMVQPDEPKPDVTEQAAKLLNMTRDEFSGFFEGVGEETLEQRARRIVGRANLDSLLDRGIANSPKEPVMDYRGRWRFRR
ncbi:hypothetical protein DID96_21955 [Burkholderia sp. Bp8963]|uniref:hypothetical protein n=1 Tax=Burkholderia sp. Bp8963 TaxID=2184547 RepID=UPI000F59578F|nr:hypothetical protein [Burkholderia sp. Bp8963]RQS67233.1 hypothetical protein DID96_21955 [Burkholderia sp. Bp8963]